MKKTAKTTLCFTKSKKTAWENPAEAERSERDLLGLGFESLGSVEASMMGFVMMAAFANKRDRCYALLHDDAQYVWVDLFCAEDAVIPTRVFAATNAAAPLIGAVAQRPTYFVSHRLPNVEVALLHAEFLRLRPVANWKNVSQAGLPDAYQLVCETDSDWQSKNLKPKTAASAMKSIVKAAYEQARRLRCQNPADELLFLLRDLQLPDSAFPPQPAFLSMAAMKGSIEQIGQFLDAGHDINTSGNDHESPLAAAASCGRLDAVEFLLQRGADPHKAKEVTHSPIAVAARGGHARVVLRLLQTQVPSEQKKEAIEGARCLGQGLVVRALKGQKLTNEELAKSDRKPDGSAKGAFVKLMDDSSLLMGREPESSITDSGERQKAEARGCLLFKRPELRDRVSTVFKEHGSYLDLAAGANSPKLMKAALAANPPKDIVSRALISAAERGLCSMAVTLLEAGADPRFQNDSGWTALLLAARRGDLAIARLLMEHGADPRARTDGGETPMTAASGPFQKEIKELLAAKAKSKPPAKGGVIACRGKANINLKTARGVGDFYNGLGHPEWSIIFAEAAPAAVAREFAKLHPTAKWYADTARHRLDAKLPLIFIFRLRGSAWTILLRTVGWLRSEDIHQVPSDACDLSEVLETRTISFMAEDTSSCTGYEMFEDGELVESAESGDAEKFKSNWRKKPKFGNQFPDPAFSDLGIYLPECWPDYDGFETKLLLGGISSESVERLDCFELR